MEIAEVFEKIKERYDGLPVLHVVETAYATDPDDQDDEYVWTPTVIYTVDLNKFDVEEDEFELRYVSRVIEACLHNGRTSGGRKYSFGDTPRWWDKFKPDEADTNRKHVHVISNVYI